MINLGCSQGCLHIVEDAADRHGRLHPCSFLVQTAVRRPGSADEGRTPLTSLFDGGVEALLGELGHHMHASPPRQMPALGSQPAQASTPGACDGEHRGIAGLSRYAPG